MFFEPRPLVNLRLVDEVDSLSPIMDIKVRTSTAPYSPCLVAYILLSDLSSRSQGMQKGHPV